MIIIIEIILTIVAWTRGWKAQALIPMGSVFAIGFFIGLTATVTAALLSALLWLDGACIVALMIMSTTGKNLPKKQPVVSEENQPSLDETQ